MSGFKVNVNFGSDTFVAKPNFDIREKANLKNIEFFENGIYKPEDYGADGFGEVNIDVQPTLEELTITQNGEYLPSEGVVGFSKVVANVVPSKRVVLPSSCKVSNEMLIDGYWAGELVDTSKMTVMTEMFYSARLIQQLDVSNWDVSKVTNMSNMFHSCSQLQQLDVSNWDVSKVTNMGSTFYGCSQLQQLDVSNWDVSEVTNMSSTFISCSQLQQLDVSNWDVSKVTNMAEVFYGCSQLQQLDVSNWDVSKVTNMSNMFHSCSALKTLIGGKTIEEVLLNNISCLNGLKVSDSSFLHNCNNLDRASLRALINGLADLTGQTSKTLTLRATLLAKLTEEDIAIATNKNWTIV